MSFPVAPMNFGHSIWVGASGKRYVHEVYNFDVEFWERPGCFIIVRGPSTPVYFGELEELSALKETHSSKLYDEQTVPYFLHVRLASPHRYERLYEVRDLKAAWLPGCG